MDSFHSIFYFTCGNLPTFPSLIGEGQGRGPRTAEVAGFQVTIVRLPLIVTIDDN